MAQNPRAIGNLLVLIIFASLGVVDLLARRYLDASLWLTLAVAFAALGSESTPWQQIPKWRKGAALLLLAVSAILFGFLIWRDFSN